MKDAIQKLDTALVQLLQTKSEQEITISDLCEQAQMDRNIFYNCYNDLSDLETAFCQRTEAQALQVCHTATDFSLVFHYKKSIRMCLQLTSSCLIPESTATIKCCSSATAHILLQSYGSKKAARNRRNRWANF